MRPNSELDSPHYCYYTVLQWLMWVRVIKTWGRTLVHFLFSSRPRQLEPDRINFSKKWFNHFCEKWNWFPIEDYLDTLLDQQVWDNNVYNGMILITVLMNLFIKYFHGRTISQLMLSKVCRCQNLKWITSFQFNDFFLLQVSDSTFLASCFNK